MNLKILKTLNYFEGGKYMRSSKDVKKRIKILIMRHLDKIYKKNFKICSENCKYNQKIDYDNEKIEHQDKLGKRKILVRSDSVRVCNFNNIQELHICHDEVDAQKCFNGCFKDRSFKFQYSRSELKEVFFKLLKNKDILNKKYPDIYNLEWVLMNERSSLWSKIKERIFFLK